MTGRVLLAGASSPLGRVLEPALVRDGWTVLGRSRSSTPPLDVLSSASMAAALEGVDLDVLVTLVNPSPVDPSMIDAHVAGLVELVDRARDRGARRVVFASSAAVYGTDSPSPRTEDSPLAGTSPYALLKIRSEEALADLAGLDLDVVALRIFNLWGPGFHNSLINRLRGEGERPRLQISRDFVRDYVHVDQVTGTAAAAFKHRSLVGWAVLNVGSGRGISTAELADRFPPEAYDAAPPGPDSWSVADMSRTHAVLGTGSTTTPLL